MKEGEVQKLLIFRVLASKAKIHGQYEGLSQCDPKAAYTSPLYSARPAGCVTTSHNVSQRDDLPVCSTLMTSAPSTVQGLQDVSQ